LLPDLNNTKNSEIERLKKEEEDNIESRTKLARMLTQRVNKDILKIKKVTGLTHADQLYEEFIAMNEDTGAKVNNLFESYIAKYGRVNRTFNRRLKHAGVKQKEFQQVDGDFFKSERPPVKKPKDAFQPVKAVVESLKLKKIMIEDKEQELRDKGKIKIEYKDDFDSQISSDHTPMNTRESMLERSGAPSAADNFAEKQEEEEEKDILKAMMKDEKDEEVVDLTEPQDLVQIGSERYTRLPVVDQARVFLLKSKKLTDKEGYSKINKKDDLPIPIPVKKTNQTKGNKMRDAVLRNQLQGNLRTTLKFVLDDEVQ